MKNHFYHFLVVLCFFYSCSAPQSPSSPPVQEQSPLVNSQKSEQENKNDSQGGAQKVQSIVTDEDMEFVQKPVDPQKMLGPTDSIKDLDQRVEKYNLGKDLSPEALEENRRLKIEIIHGTFDIRELCRLSLDKHWDKITDEQKKYFVKLMIRLLESKAIFSKEQVKGESKYYKITYRKEEIDKSDPNRATVYSNMNIPKDRMSLDLTYKLRKTEYGWKIYDVIVDDASLLTNYKFQFDKIIQTSGFQELINRMEKKLTKISGED